MVARLASLVLLFCLVASTDCSAESRPLCLACHPLHYGQRGTCTGCHRGNAAAVRKNVAHHLLIAGKYAGFTLGATAIVKKGELLMEALSCRRCHVSAGRGNRFATSLDSLLEAKPVPEIAAAIGSPAWGMPDFRLPETEITAIVNALLSGTEQSGKTVGERPLAVYFKNTEHVPGDVFSKKCGGCHRMFSDGGGLLGTGEIGPNLSGLLTRFYPETFPKGKRWTLPRLRSWIGNPRKLKPGALMPPVKLDRAQLRELAALPAKGEL